MLAGGNITIANSLTVIVNSGVEGAAQPSGEPIDLNPQFEAAKSYINKYAIDAALGVLEKIESDNQHRFTNFTWARLLALRASALYLKGDGPAAARLFLKAKQNRPDGDEPAFWEINAHKMLGDGSKAFLLATDAKSKYGESTKIATAWLQSAPESFSFAQLIGEIPVHLQTEPEVAIGLAIAAQMRGLDAEAINYAWIAADKATDMVDAKVLWASMTISQFTKAELLPAVLEKDRDSVSKACGVIRNAIERTRSANNAAVQAHDYMTLSVGELVLGHIKESDEAIETAFKLLPDHDETRRHYSLSLVRRNELDKAIVVLDRDIVSKPVQMQLLWAQLRAQRAVEDDLAVALEILRTNLDRLDGLGDRFRASWVDTLVKILIEQKQFDDVELALKDLAISKHLLQGCDLILAGESHLAQGNVEMARTMALSADEQLQSINPIDNQELAILLQRLDEKPRSLARWKKAITPFSSVPKLRQVMVLASQVEDKEYVLQLGGEVRSRGVFDVSLIDIELNVRLDVSSIKAAEFLTSLIEELPEEKLRRYLRMRRSLLGIELKRDDLIERDLQKLPHLLETDEDICDAVVVAVRQINFSQAIHFAYELFRRFPDSKSANWGMIIVIMRDPRSIPAGAIPEVTTVAEDTAVFIKNINQPGDTWYVIEGRRDVKPSLNEMTKDGPVALALQGKSAGDEVEIKEAFGTSRRVRIEAIQHKWLFRFQQCLRQFPIKFPEQTMFKTFSVNESLPVEEGFREILGFMDSEEVRHEKALAAYRDNIAVPLGLLATGLGTTIFGAMSQIVATNDLRLRCWSGIPERTVVAEAALVSPLKIVLEASVLGTLFLLDVYFNFAPYTDMANWPFKCLVSERTMEEMEKYLERLSSTDERLRTQRYGGKIIAHITSSEEMARFSERLRPKFGSLVDAIKKHCEVVPGSPLTHVPIHLRKAINCLGAAGQIPLTLQRRMMQCFGPTIRFLGRSPQSN